MFNLKSNLLFAGLISATTLLTGIAFTSGAMANSDKDSSSSWEHSCPSYYHYDNHCHKCVKDYRDSDDRSSKDSSHDSSKGGSSHDSDRDSSKDSSSGSSHHSSRNSNHGSSHDTSHNSGSNSNHKW